MGCSCRTSGSLAALPRPAEQHVGQSVQNNCALHDVLLCIVVMHGLTLGRARGLHGALNCYLALNLPDTTRALICILVAG
jgi:hypothetical protein